MTHPELTTPTSAAARVCHDTLVHLVRKPGMLRMVRVAVPRDWDASAFGGAVAQAYADRGMPPVQVFTVPTDGECRLLSVVTG